MKAEQWALGNERIELLLQVPTPSVVRECLNGSGCFSNLVELSP